MNTNPGAKRILCYGDSNTWGYVPIIGDRFPANMRWTGLLQESLGDDYEIIEEGLNGRTTTLYHPTMPWKNGKTYLVPCLSSHNPLDLIILFLGANDLQTKYNRRAEDIVEGVRDLINVIRENAYTPKKEAVPVLILPPAIVDNSVAGVSEKLAADAEEKSSKLVNLYQELALEENCFFPQTSAYVVAGKQDGYHLDTDGHKQLAGIVHSFISSFFTPV